MIDQDNPFAANHDSSAVDLGPLSWVVGSLRETLDGVSGQLIQFSSAIAAASGHHLSTLDTTPLRLAAQGLHEAAGALDLIERPAAAQMVGAMEHSVRLFVESPELCTPDAARLVAQAGSSVIDYLASVLGGRPDYSVGLFPIYREVAELARLDRIHPADLWHHTWQWLETDDCAPAQTIPLPENTPLFLECVLQLFRSGGKQGAPELAAHTRKAWQDSLHPRERIFWQMATGFLQTLSTQALPFDDPVKRLLSRTAVQYDLLQQGASEVSQRLTHDLLFFIALGSKTASQDPAQSATPLAAAIVRRYGLDLASVCAYDTLIYGNAGPAERKQLHEALSAFKELWSDVCAGDVHKINALAEQVTRMIHGMETVWPSARQLPDTLHGVIRNIQQTGQAPRPDLAMELATAVLFLEAAAQEHQHDDQEFIVRTDLLAQRLAAALNGIQAAPLTGWMEALYARISDRDSLGQVVTESRSAMGEVERALDDFFRHPQKTEQARASIAKLETIASILMMLNCEEAGAAVSAMTRQVQQLVEASEQTGAIDDAKRRANVLRLGNSLGALAFMFDMIGYQPDRARTQFHFDAANQELVHTPSQPGFSPAPTGPFSETTPLFSPSPNQSLVPALDNLVSAQTSGGLSPADAARQLDSVIQQAELAGQPGLAQQARQALSSVQTAAAAGDSEGLAQAISVLAPVAEQPVDSICDTPIEEEDLRDIFLEEAAEVIDKARTAINALEADRANTEPLTNLRRAFHTLKGSGRMVGLASFGEAAWAMERLLNGWLADGKPATPALLQLAAAALDALALWRESIARQEPSPWHHACFAQSAAELQQHGLFAPFAATQAVSPADDQVVTPAAQESVAGDASRTRLDALFAPETKTTPADDPEQTPEPPLFSDDLPQAPVTSQSCLAASDSTAPLLLAPGVVAAAPAQEFAAAHVTFTFDTQETNGEEQPSLPAKPTQWAQTGADEGLASARPAVSCNDTAPSQPETGNTAWSAPKSTPEQGWALPSGAFAPAEPDHPSPAQAQTPMSPSLAGILVNIAPQLAVLHDMVEGLHEDDIKRISDVRIPLALFNTYLNEADTWSRQLVQELGEWALDSRAPIPESCGHLAHSLAGSSATVGIGGLASMARGIEHALDHIARRTPHPGEADILLHAAETVRQGLHQFAAGLQRPADMALLGKLAAIVDNAPPQTASASHASSALEHGHGLLPGAEKKTAENPSLSIALTDPVRQAADVEPDAAGSSAKTTGGEDGTSGPLEPVSPTRPAGSVRIDAPPASTTNTDGNDALDPELFAIFREEAQALIPQLNAVVRQWSARPDNEGARQKTLRLLHTLKGGARLAGAMRLGAMAHEMESAISEIGRAGNNVLSGEMLESLQIRLDDIDRLFTLLLQEGHPSEISTHGPPASTEAIFCDSPPASPGSAAAGLAENTAVLPGMTGLPAQHTSQPLVRVRSNILDRMLGRTGEIMTSRARLETEVQQLRQAMEEMDGSLDRLRIQLRDMELQAESQMQSRMAQSADSHVHFDPLEFDRFTRVQELTRMMAESVSDVASVRRSMALALQSSEDNLVSQTRQARELQGDLLHTRMVEFDSLSDRLYRVVRQAAREESKQVSLDIIGGQTEMDRSIIDRIAASFEHLLRNAVVHGIESAQQRAQMGKDPVGRINIRLHQEGGDVIISVRDDGRGLDLQCIRDKATAENLLQTGSTVSDEETAQLIFRSGISTADTITPLAGRGVGLDVVRTEINALGGRIELQNHPHAGAEFTLVLPLTTAVTQVVEVQAGDLHFGVPSNLVESVRRTSAKEIERAYNTQVFSVNDEDLPFYWGGAMLQSSRRSSDMAAKHQVVVVLRSAAQRMVMHVDAVLGNHEVVVKNIGPQLSRMPGLCGITILPNGLLLFIYNPVALSFLYEEQIRSFSSDRADPATLGGDVANASCAADSAASEPLVLVVDDSITVRRVTERLLRREGYRVALAADGMAALRELAAEKPAIVLSDIEMPQMDGFDLLRNIRNDPNCGDLPVIMITSRTADKHREHALELGANDFLGKPYQEGQLLELVRQYVRSCTSASGA